ncbi:MAG: hypothetical protein JW757_07970 [Anaerolineales bacterium]|nr:hypothetical protein [Anaerolineales bacterium]
MAGRRVILTGLPGSGKSALCQAVVRRADEAGLDLQGVLSPPVFENGVKIGIDLLDLGSRERHQLAVLRQEALEPASLTTQRWTFDPQIIEIGEQILASSTPCELLVVDELGPLEFERGEGWLAGLTAVDSSDFQAALVVVRPSLVEIALKRWPDAQTIEIESAEQVPARLPELLKLLGIFR